MEKDSKQRKFHEALMKIYLPPPPPPVRSDQGLMETEDKEFTENVPEKLKSDASFSSEPDDDETACCSSEDIDERAPKILTRAQRKKIRKKKLKEAALYRRKIIGPLLQSVYVISDKVMPQTNVVNATLETNNGSQHTRR